MMKPLELYGSGGKEVEVFTVNGKEFKIKKNIKGNKMLENMKKTIEALYKEKTIEGVSDYINGFPIYPHKCDKYPKEYIQELHNDLHRLGANKPTLYTIFKALAIDDLKTFEAFVGGVAVDAGAPEKIWRLYGRVTRITAIISIDKYKYNELDNLIKETITHPTDESLSIDIPEFKTRLPEKVVKKIYRAFYTWGVETSIIVNLFRSFECRDIDKIGYFLGIASKNLKKTLKLGYDQREMFIFMINILFDQLYVEAKIDREYTQVTDLVSEEDVNNTSSPASTRSTNTTNTTNTSTTSTPTGTTPNTNKDNDNSKDEAIVVGGNPNIIITNNESNND